jgi:hypothetical protein
MISSDRPIARSILVSSLTLLAVLALAASSHAQSPAAPPPAAPPPSAPPSAAPPPPPLAYGQPNAQPPYGQPYAQPGYGQPYAQPGYAQPGYPAPYAPRPRLRKGLMISGIAVLGASYLIPLFTGIVIHDVHSCDNCRPLANRLFIPLAGPFLAMGPARNGEAALAMLGTLQIVGLGMLVGGVFLYVHSKQQAREQGYYVLDLPEGRSLAFDMSASPARLGPSLRLRF